MNFNPMKLIPKKLINNNPIIQNLVKMAERGANQSIEQFAINFCKEKGINFEEEFPKFMEQYNQKR